MRCKVCSEEHRVLSDGNDVPRYVRAACKCERRDVCGAKRDCVEKVVGVTLEPDGKTTDSLVCLAHVPPGFDDDDFKLPIDLVSIAVELVAVVGNPIDHHAGQRASMTAARALRVLGEGLGDSVSARLIYVGTERDRLGGPWLVRVRFNVRQFDTY
jgi:hypothetical protein